MEPKPAENFFEISVNQEGAENISRMYRWVKWVFAACVVLCTLLAASGVLRMIFYSKVSNTAGQIFKLESVVSPIYTVVAITFAIGQWYSFFYFSRQCKKSIELRQADLFNRSFRLMQKFMVFTICLMCVEMLMVFFNIGVNIYFLRNLP